MYAGLLQLHNALRWLVLIAAVVAIAMAIHGIATRRAWGRPSRLSGTIFVIAMDVQLVVGLVLYAVSPVVRGGLADLSAAMADSTTRFFVVEHLVLMVLAVAAAHVGAVTARRATSDRVKHSRAALWWSVSLLLVVLAIPWWRPLLPGLA